MATAKTARCAVCAAAFTYTVAPGRPPVSCSAACQHERRNATARRRRAAELELLELARAIQSHR